MISKSVLAENIYRILKKNNIKVGEFENELDVGQGYFSRLLNGKTPYPNIEIIEYICTKFHINIETLIKNDFNDFTDEEIKIESFLNSLISKTKEHKINWEAISAENLYDYELRDRMKSEHPNLKYKSYMDNVDFIFYSNFTNTEVEIIDVVFTGYFRNNLCRLYKTLLKNSSIVNYELYMDSDGENYPVYSTYYGLNLKIKSLVSELYELCDSQMKNPTLSNKLCSLIDEFID